MMLRCLIPGAVVAVTAWGTLPDGAAAQEAEFLRIGFTYGSLARFGLSLEYLWDQTGAEVIVGTRHFNDVEISAMAKQYLGEGPVKAYVGFGLSNVTEWGHQGGVATGLLLRVPVGAEFRTFDANWLGLDISAHRALAVKRADPEDHRPPRTFIIPLPGAYWKYGSRRAGDGY